MPQPVRLTRVWLNVGAPDDPDHPAAAAASTQRNAGAPIVRENCEGIRTENQACAVGSSAVFSCEESIHRVGVIQTAFPDMSIPMKCSSNQKSTTRRKERHRGTA